MLGVPLLFLAIGLVACMGFARHLRRTRRLRMATKIGTGAEGELGAVRGWKEEGGGGEEDGDGGRIPVPGEERGAEAHNWKGQVAGAAGWGAEHGSDSHSRSHATQSEPPQPQQAPARGDLLLGQATAGADFGDVEVQIEEKNRGLAAAAGPGGKGAFEPPL